MFKSLLAAIKNLIFRILGIRATQQFHIKLAQYSDGSHSLCLNVSLDPDHIPVTSCGARPDRGVSVSIVGPQPNERVQGPVVHVTAIITGGPTSESAWLTNSSTPKILPDGPPVVAMNQYTWTWTNKTPVGSYLATVQASDGSSTTSQSVAFTVV
jgi:hypothetical protein